MAKNDTTENVTHYILSKDKGFDPLIAFVNKKKNVKFVKRIISLNDIGDSNSKDEDKKSTATSNIKGKYDKVLKNLKGISKTTRPKSEKTLKAHILAFSKNEKWTEKEIQNIIEELYRQGNISKGSKNRLSYSI